MKPFLFISIALLLSSCTAVIQKAYLATSPNVNCFVREKEKNIKASVFANHVEIQSNLAFTHHFGVSAGVNLAFKSQAGFELAGIYYTNIQPKTYLEIQAGYGYFDVDSDIDSKPMDIGASIEYGKHLTQNARTGYHKIFIQPAYFFTSENINVGLALKIGMNYFDHYYYYHEVKDDSEGDYAYDLTYSQSDFKSRWGLSVEPAVKLQFKPGIFLQMSALLTSNVSNSPVYEQHYHQAPVESGHLSNPQHLYYVLSIGYELKMGKKKTR
jgi:hypothetical protein